MERESYIYMMSNYSNKTLYIGVTSDLQKRIYQHKKGSADGFTKKYKINKLLYYENYSDIRDAIEREKQLKKLSRNKKEVLITKNNSEWIDLSKGLWGWD